MLPEQAGVPFMMIMPQFNMIQADCQIILDPRKEMNTGYKTVEEYIIHQPEWYRANLELIRQTIKATVPEAVEVISYQMPAFKYHGMLCFFAVFRDHYSLFVSPKIKDAFSDKLTSYKQTKSAIHFPLKSQIPVELVREIITFTAITNLERAENKKSRSKK
jgi:uncharacterized protein YdhG (YjbR/CyaY superfamily)